jgi:small GTP-binding protein
LRRSIGTEALDVPQDKSEDKPGRGGRASDLARNLFSVGNLMRLPANLATLRSFMGLTRFDELHREVQSELARRIAIVGLPNAGKSTLFNTLHGRRVSAVSEQAGTTTELIRGSFGPFLLIDTPGHLPEVQRSAVDEAAVVLFLLDASRGLRPEERTLLHDLRRTNKPLVVALNKADVLRADPDAVAGELAARLNVPDVIPIAARPGENVAEELVPALLNASPDAALAVGVALPAFRRQAAARLIRNATVVGLAAGLQPIPLVDIPILLGNQIRLVLRIAALYGEPMDARHARELVTTLISGLALRYLAEEAAKLVPFGGDVVAGAIAAAGTWAIGQVAIEYFEGGKQLSSKQLSTALNRYYRRYREEHLEQGLSTAQSQAQLGSRPEVPSLPMPASDVPTTESTRRED